MSKEDYIKNRFKKSMADKEEAPEESGAFLKSYESASITGLKHEIQGNYYEEISERSELKESVKTGSSFMGKPSYEHQTPKAASEEETASDPEQPKTGNTGLASDPAKEKVKITKKRKSELLGINYKNSEESSESSNQSLVTGLKKNTIKDKAENIKKEAEKTGDENYHERNKAADTEATENAVSGNAKGFAVAKVKKGANTLVQTVKKGAGAAGNLTEAPENMIKGYSKARAKKEQIEKIDVEGVAKDFGSFVSHFFISIAKKVVKYLMLLIGTLGLAFVIVMLMFFLLIFIVFVAVTGYDESAATSTVSASVTNNSEIIDGCVYINQGDYEDVSMGGGQTISESGCGLTCLASVLATYTGNTSITPVTVINYARSHNTATSDSGAYLVCYSLYNGLAEEYGVNCDIYYSVTHDYIYEALTTGKSVVVKLTSESKWTDGTAVTTGTHFIVLLAYTDTANRIIACMNPSGGKTSYIAESTILNDSGCTYMYVFYN